MGFCRVRDQRRDPVSSLLSSSMPDRARMHAANLTERSQCGVAARTRLAQRSGRLNRRMKGFEGEPMRRGGMDSLPARERRATFRGASRDADRFGVRGDRRNAREERAPLASRGDLARAFGRLRLAFCHISRCSTRLADCARSGELFTGPRVAHVARISERLRADGIGVPEILLIGSEPRGREIIATASVVGFSVVRYFRTRCETLAAKRAVLHAARRGSRAAASRRLHSWRPFSVQHIRHACESVRNLFSSITNAPGARF